MAKMAVLRSKLGNKSVISAISALLIVAISAAKGVRRSQEGSKRGSQMGSHYGHPGWPIS